MNENRKVFFGEYCVYHTIILCGNLLVFQHKPERCNACLIFDFRCYLLFKGDPEAMNIVVQHYESYIASLSMRKLRDERGNIYWGIDEDIRDRLRSRLMRAVLSFKV